ncbi:MAG: hypothetical protein B6244_08545 [Candidatus Cloacimonetes bacterium 4572_55]|nr:MAG: hypothetical protein B6244_08545 [Candidatus Cloacimonetes bacterium 4572_55]
MKTFTKMLKLLLSLGLILTCWSCAEEDDRAALYAPYIFDEAYEETEETYDVFFNDNFNDGVANGWDESEEGTFQVVNGAYRFTLDSDGYLRGAYHELTPFRQFSFSADYRVVGDWKCGLAMSSLDDQRNIYVFINSDNQLYVPIWEWNADHSAGEWRDPRVIEPIDIDPLSGWNTINWTYNSEGTMQVRLNDTLVAETFFNDIQAFDGITLFAVGDLTVEFDNVEFKGKSLSR